VEKSSCTTQPCHAPTVGGGGGLLCAQEINPCGLIAWSFFNDTYSFSRQAQTDQPDGARVSPPGVPLTSQGRALDAVHMS
jgi:hypothetical protein